MMKPDIETLIREVKAHDASATQGEWRLWSGGGYVSVGVAKQCEVLDKRHGSMHPYWDQQAGRELGYGNTVEPWMHDLALIVHYRTAAPLLAAEVERLAAENAMIDGANVSLLERVEKAEQECAALRLKLADATATHP